MSPGNTALPRPSMRSAPGQRRSISWVGPMATMRSASTAIEASWCTVRAASEVTMVVLWMTSAIRLLLLPGVGAAPAGLSHDARAVLFRQVQTPPPHPALSPDGGEGTAVIHCPLSLFRGTRDPAVDAGIDERFR